MRALFFVVLSLVTIIDFGQQLEHETTANIDSIVKDARGFALTSHTDSASLYFDKAIAIAKDSRDSSAISSLLVEKGKVHEAAGNFSQSIIAYIEGLAISKHIHNKLNEGLCYLGLSNTNFRVANNEGAWEQGLMAMKCFESLNDTSHYILASMLVGQVEISLGKFDEAYAIYSNMLSVAQNISDSALIADNLDHLGVIHTFKKEYKKALPLHEKAMAINMSINNQFNLLINYANLGEVYMRIGNYSKALTLLNTAQNLGKRINANSVLIYIYYTLGECYSLIGESTLALQNLNKSLNMIRDQGEARERPYVYNLLSEHYERNHDYLKSLLFFRKFSTERDSLRIASSTYAMEELKIKYEADKKENDLRSALLENNLKAAMLKQTNQTINMLVAFIGISIIGLIITGILVVRLYRSEKNLKMANSTKDALLSIIGHDLRGPVASIEQLSYLLKESKGEERERIINMISTPAHTALNLLDDLLAWSRSTRQKSVSDKNTIYVVEIINRSIELFTEQANAKQIQLTANIPDNLTVFADVNHVLSILRNLISNAIKFTPAGGKVTIDHHSENEKVTVRVSDTGLGISPQHIKVILDGKFFTTFGTQNEKGSGFGLMLCQEFVRLNNGTLKIESVVGKGSTISFTLPAPTA